MSNAAAAGAPGARDSELVRRLAEVRSRIAAAVAAAGRPAGSVRLVAVTKGFPATDALLLRRLGQSEFGEARLAELLSKAAQLASGPPVRWHFVGRLQRNKARRVAAASDLVHSLDRAALIPPLAAGRPGGAVLVQISLDGDPERGGVAAADAEALADAAAAEGLVVAGVMAVVPLDEEPRAAFARLARTAEVLRRSHPTAREISAGMSGDLEQAIAEGATLVRVGTALLAGKPAGLG